MVETGAPCDADDGFRRIFDHLKAVLTEIDAIRRTNIMIMSGPDLNTLLDIADDERDLERDLHILECRLKAHRD